MILSQTMTILYFSQIIFGSFENYSYFCNQNIIVKPLKIMIMKRKKANFSVESSFSSDFIWKLFIN